MQKNPIDAYVETKHPSLYMLGKRDEKALKIGLWNLYDDKCEGIRIKIGKPFENVEFISCKGHREGDSVVIDSTIFPYEFCAVRAI